MTVALFRQFLIFFSVMLLNMAASSCNFCFAVIDPISTADAVLVKRLSLLLVCN